VKPLVLASGNPGKLRELAALLAPLQLQLIAQGDLGIESVPETGNTFLANAVLKARHAAARSGLAALADDSGLEVDALGGRPGVWSARFAGEGASDEQNLALLIERVPAGSALAHVCAIAYVDPGQALERVFEGRCEGTMASEARGSGGFGYDPVFVPTGGDGRTMAQLDAGEKDALSHRGAALRALAAWLAERGSP